MASVGRRPLRSPRRPRSCGSGGRMRWLVVVACCGRVVSPFAVPEVGVGCSSSWRRWHAFPERRVSLRVPLRVSLPARERRGWQARAVGTDGVPLESEDGGGVGRDESSLSPEALSGNGASIERQSVVLKPETLTVGAPQVKQKKEIGIEDMLRELREIQGQGPRGYCILGTRHCSYLHQQIIELLSYALVLSDNHVYTSGSSGTNAAAIRGALRAENPELLTVVLPQSLHKQPQEARELVEKVKNVIQMPENDCLPLEVASRICNRRLISLADQLVAFAFHASHTVVEASHEAEDMDKIVTVMYLD